MPYYLGALEQDFKKTNLNSCWDFYTRERGIADEGQDAE